MFIIVKYTQLPSGKRHLQSSTTSVIHNTRDDAVAEAKRLAGREAGDYQYIVLEAVAVVKRVTAPVEIAYLK